MRTIIVHTDFSTSSHNALAYTCAMVHEQEVQLVLLHVYTIPAMYTGDGIAITTISNSFAETEERLEDEVEWVREEYPGIRISSKAVVGGFMESLSGQVKAIRPALVVMGAAVHSDDLWSFDAEVLDAFIDLEVPVLTIPKNVQYTQVQQICFACNVRFVNPQTPFEAIRKIVEFTRARLHIVFVVPHALKEKGITGHPAELLIHETFGAYSPVYHAIPETQIVHDIGEYIKAQQIGLLIVIPRRQGVYDSLFHKSNTKALARINDIPVIAIREQ